MSKPAYYLVFAENRETRKFAKRSAARLYRASLKLAGISAIIQAVGF